MAINPDDITTIRVDQLSTGSLDLTKIFPFSEANGELKQSSIQDLVDLVSTAISTSGGVGYYPLAVTDGQQLPDLPETPSFFLCGAGTYLNINGYPDIICTAELNAIMTVTDHWALAVEIPITAPIGVLSVTGSAVDNTDPQNPVINSSIGALQQTIEAGNEYTQTIGDFTYTFNVFKDFGAGGELLIDITNNVTNEQFQIGGSTGGGQIFFKDVDGNQATFNLTNNASIGQSSYLGTNTIKIPKKTSGSGETIFLVPNDLPAGEYELSVDGGGGTLESVIASDPTATSTPVFNGGISGKGSLFFLNNAETSNSFGKDDYVFFSNSVGSNNDIDIHCETEDGANAYYRFKIIDKTRSYGEFGIENVINTDTLRFFKIGALGSTLNNTYVLVDDFNQIIDLVGASVRVNGTEIENFNPADHDLDEFNNASGDPYAHISDLPSLSGLVVQGVNDATSSALTASDLNTSYPTATTGFKVYCDNITTVYEKTPSGWIEYSYTITT